MRKLFALALMLVVVAASIAWALSVTTSTRSVQLTEETFSSDADSTITLNGIEKAVAAAAAAGDTGPGVEATTANAAVNNAVTEGNWVYKFTVTESAVAAWPATRQYKLLVYTKTGTDWVLTSTLYFKNATIDDLATEGVAVSVDVGSSSTVPDGYSVELVKVQ